MQEFSLFHKEQTESKLNEKLYTLDKKVFETKDLSLKCEMLDKMTQSQS